MADYSYSQVCVYCKAVLSWNALWCRRCGYSVHLGFPQAKTPPPSEPKCFPVKLPERKPAPQQDPLVQAALDKKTELTKEPVTSKKGMTTGSLYMLSNVHDIMLDLANDFVSTHKNIKVGDVVRYLKSRILNIFSFPNLDAFKAYCQKELGELHLRLSQQ